MRKEIPQKTLDITVELIKNKLASAIHEKGCGSYISRHEILGTITEEYFELVEAIKSGRITEEVFEELIDVIISSLWGVASIMENKEIK